MIVNTWKAWQLPWPLTTNVPLQGEDLTLCKNLSVLYLYDNKVERIPDLSQNYCLTHIYLQNNQITEMHNLNLIRKLTKL